MLAALTKRRRAIWQVEGRRTGLVNAERHDRSRQRSYLVQAVFGLSLRRVTGPAGQSVDDDGKVVQRLAESSLEMMTELYVRISAFVRTEPSHQDACAFDAVLVS